MSFQFEEEDLFEDVEAFFDTSTKKDDSFHWLSKKKNDVFCASKKNIVFFGMKKNNLVEFSNFRFDLKQKRLIRTI